MTRGMLVRSRAFALALAVLLGLAPGVWAQISKGNIYGNLADEQGAIVPGATITLTGATIGTRTTTSAASGDFRFLNLDPGTYKLSVSLSNFATLTRDVKVTVGENVNVGFQMKLSAVQETVTVNADTPVVDSKKTGTGTTLDREELAMIPTSRDPWAVLRQVPGVMVDRLNQAGSQSGQQSGYTGKGSSQQSSMWVIDGVVVTDPAAAGSSPSYYDFDAFEQVSVTTGGADIKVGSGGVGINLVTKRGTNEFHGGARGFYTNDGLESGNVPSAMQSDPRLHLNGGDGTKGDHVDQIADYGFDIGGPVLKDKLWFWGSYGKQDIRIRKFNQLADKTLLKDLNAKINWQATPNDMFSVFYFNGMKEKFGRSATPTGSVSVGSEDASHTRDQASAYDNPLHGLLKAELNHVFNPSFVGNVKYSYYDQGFSLTPEGGTGGDEFIDRVNSIAHGSSYLVGTVRPAHTVNADFNYFSGSHELKFGFGYRKASVLSTTAPSGNQIRGVLDPTRGRYAIVERESIAGFHGAYTDLYLGDTYTKNRLTVNAGLRFDHQTAENLPTSAKANPLYPEILPALNYDGSPGQDIKWNDISPRLGFTYALTSDHKTQVRGSFAIFTDQLNFADVTDVNPVGTVGQKSFAWTDLNNDNVVQRGELNLARPDILPPVAVTPSTVNAIDPNFKSKRDLELIGGIDHELIPNLQVSLSYTFRRTSRVYYAPYIGVNGTDWIPCESVSSNGFSVPCFDAGPTNAAALDANGFGLLTTNRPDYSRHYKGVEFTALKRLSNKWMGRVAFSYNDWTEHFDGTAGIQDPNPSQFDTYGGLSAGGQDIVTDAKVNGGQLATFSSGSGTVYWIAAKWQLSASGLYQLPAGFDIAANLFARQGFTRPINISVDNAVADTNLAAPLGSSRVPNIYNLDLRLAKNINLSSSKVKLAITADAFNVFNGNTTLRQVDAADSSAFGRVDEIQSPRLVRFGLRLGF